MKDNIFDLVNIEDLPVGMVLKKGRKLGNNEVQSLLLFKMKSHLTVSELQAGLFRKFKVELTVKKIHSSIIGTLLRAKEITRVSVGVYQIAKEVEK